MRQQRGFTLIELLVVISTIALLMAILMPALANAKRQAKVTICKARLKQWGYIWFLYTEDNEGSFNVGMRTGMDWYRGEWIIALRPYIMESNKAKLVCCPMAIKPSIYEYGGPHTTYTIPKNSLGLGERGSYSMNVWFYNLPKGTTEIQHRPAKYHWRNINVEPANNIPLFLDSMWRGGGPFDTDAPPDYNGQWRGYDAEMNHFCIDRHEGAVNGAFLDCSLRRIGLKELWKLKWHRSFNINGPWTGPGISWPKWMRNFKEY